MLDGKAAIPLYVQLEEQIQEKILSGIYQPGEKLQTEGEMAKTYGVSIITVRKAVGGLIDKGLVERKQGKGTFVSKPKYMRDIKKVQSFSDMCRSMGLEPGGRMIENRLVVPEAEIEENLGQQKGMQAVLFHVSGMRITSRWQLKAPGFRSGTPFCSMRHLTITLCLTVSRSARWRSFIPRKKLRYAVPLPEMPPC